MNKLKNSTGFHAFVEWIPQSPAIGVFLCDKKPETAEFDGTKP